jgi:hypothetical protein
MSFEHLTAPRSLGLPIQLEILKAAREVHLDVVLRGGSAVSHRRPAAFSHARPAASESSASRPVPRTFCLAYGVRALTTGLTTFYALAGSTVLQVPPLSE